MVGEIDTRQFFRRRVEGLVQQRNAHVEDPHQREHEHEHAAGAVLSL